ncbi:hypothetical protein BDV97DRAFT_290642 [Delphinella strobiligena]|nr:hypothetical protein BDV97DRAFT_290642 [Delphinella strobiligena]
MFTSRRLAPLLFAGFTTFLIYLLFQTTELTASLRQVPQAVGLGEEEYDEEVKEAVEGEPVPYEEAVPPTSWANPNALFVAGVPKAPNSEYSKTIVIPRVSSENTSWIEQELGDILYPNGPLQTAIYVVDDPHAELHPPKNKGHEVMVYLSYIIDHYENLPDISLFMHAHRVAWHNDDALDYDAAQMVRSLSAERVIREGYMNLRCHWDPGCPDWMHPGTTERTYEKQEEVLIAESWSELFPMDPIPPVLSQPCCAQFALSRERILALPLSRYVFFRDWLLRTPLDDYISGRVWEYLWQYIFTGHAVECPAMHICYCDGYGLCFGGADKFNEWFELRYHLLQHQQELRDWLEKDRVIKEAHDLGQFDEASLLEVPELGRNEWLVNQIALVREDLNQRRSVAFNRGRFAHIRAEEAGRPWKEGDGF